MDMDRLYVFITVVKVTFRIGFYSNVTDLYDFIFLEHEYKILLKLAVIRSKIYLCSLIGFFVCVLFPYSLALPNHTCPFICVRWSAFLLYRVIALTKLLVSLTESSALPESSGTGPVAVIVLTWTISFEICIDRSEQLVSDIKSTFWYDLGDISGHSGVGMVEDFYARPQDY